MINSIDIEELRYPTGKYRKPDLIMPDQIKDWITEIERFPSRLKTAIDNIGENELNWQYRPEGWTIRQVIHHCADSHMNSLIRFKLTLTEDTPTIKPYYQDKWAELYDSTDTPVFDSLKIIEGLHSRWSQLLKSLKSDDLRKEFIHPEYGKRFSIGETIALYAWHSNHHLAHVKQALKYKNNFDSVDTGVR